MNSVFYCEKQGKTVFCTSLQYGFAFYGSFEPLWPIVPIGWFLFGDP